MNPWEIGGLVLAFFVIWKMVVAGGDAIVDGQPDLDDDDGEWFGPDEKPVERGRYVSRWPKSPSTESLSTYWNGSTWRYLDGAECYQQHREWKPLPEGMAA